MCITSQNHIFLFQNGEFCDDIAILDTENNILVWFQANFGQKLVKMVNFGELWPKFGHLKPI